MEKLYISQDGLTKLTTELEALSRRRLKVADAIEDARKLGDLSENAEYHTAKDEQALIHAKMKDLEDKIARSRILDDQDIDPSKAYLGAMVRVRNQKTNKELTYTLVSTVEADLRCGKISTQSPVGKAMLGKSVGDVVVAKVPAGDIPLEILEIAR